MTDEQIRLLLSLGRDEARVLLDHNEYYRVYPGFAKGVSA